MPKTIVITGAGRGIGRELVLTYAASGGTVIAGVRHPAMANAFPSTIQVEDLDVTEPSSIAAFQRRLAGRPVDILINNAGTMGGDRQALLDMDYEAWRQAFNVNTIAPFHVTTTLLPNLERAERAKVITFTSQMGSLNRKSLGSFAYRSSKAAANKVMQVMAEELRPRGIIVCPMHPGWVKTDMGGSGADISVEQSVAGLIAVIANLEMADSGRFWTWDGKEHPW